MAASCSAGKGYEVFYLLFSRKGAKKRLLIPMNRNKQPPLKTRL